MADAILWPSALVPSSEDWSLRGGTRSGGQTFQGNEQVVASPTARWKATLTIPCMRREAALAMRSVVALGRSTVWMVGPFERSRAPWNVDFIGGKITDRQGQIDAAANPAFETDPTTTSLLDFSLFSVAAMGATTLAIKRLRGGVLEPGMIFGMNGRMHIITGLPFGELADPGDIGPPGVITAEVRPPMRADCPAGAVIDFARPACPMRLATDDTAALSLDLSRLGSATVEMVEAF